MATRTLLHESVTVVRRENHLPGIEVLRAENTAREWRVYNHGHCIAVPQTWDGEADYRRRRCRVGPGMAFCTEPGEVHRTPRVFQPGTFRVWIIRPDTFREYLTEHTGSSATPRWRLIAGRVSPMLVERLGALFQLMEEGGTALELQSGLVSLIHRTHEELLDGLPTPTRTSDDLGRAAQRIRECLHADECGQLDLNGLARAVGMTRFQVHAPPDRERRFRGIVNGRFAPS